VNTTASDKPTQTPLASSRLLSAGELLVGAGIVIGHNVFRVVPNEVPILVVLAIASMRLRNGGWAWSSLGFKRPDSWTQVLAIAAAAAVLRIVLGEYVIDPLTAHFWPPAIEPEIANEVKGHLGTFLLYLPIIWGFAAFGEEIAYRGYLLNRAADCGGRSMLAFWIAVIVSSVLFGYGHYYKGPSGIIDSGVAGFILGSAYVLSGRNLWVAILAHGFIDTFGLTLAFLGLDE
jgi:membrane protease YdiL (CAAX protease family)